MGGIEVAWSLHGIYCNGLEWDVFYKQHTHMHIATRWQLFLCVTVSSWLTLLQLGSAWCTCSMITITPCLLWLVLSVGLPPTSVAVARQALF